MYVHCLSQCTRSQPDRHILSYIQAGSGEIGIVTGALLSPLYNNSLINTLIAGDSETSAGCELEPAERDPGNYHLQRDGRHQKYDRSPASISAPFVPMS